MTHDRKDGAGHVQRTEEVRLHLCAELFGADLFEVSGIEVAGIVHENVDAAEPIDRSLRGGDRGLRVGDIQRDGQQVIVCADGLEHPIRIASGRDDGVSCGQGLLSDIDAQPPAGTCDEPDLAHVSLPFPSPASTASGNPRLDGIICMDLENGFLNAAGQRE